VRVTNRVPGVGGSIASGVSGGVLALLVVFGSLPAPARAQAPERSWGTITGTVYDSLLGSPLSGATVWLMNSSRSAQTDERGRFAFDSVPAGPQTLSFWRADLDSIGLTAFVGRVTVEAGRSASVALAVPSHATFWRRTCGRLPPPQSPDTGLVFGTVADAETGQRLAGVEVLLSWVTVERTRRKQWVVLYPDRLVTTDSAGAYYLCGTPVEYLLAARARSDVFASGLVEVLVNLRGIARRDLALSRERIPGAPDSGAGRRGLATLAGSVRGERGGLLPGAYASIEDVDGSVEVDSLGRFVLSRLPSGTHMLMVRRIGYFASRQAVDLRNRDTTRVDVTLAEATVLDTLRVTASQELVSLVDEINARRRIGFGYLASQPEIHQHGTLRSVFEAFPMMEARGSTHNFSLVVRGGVGRCAPDIYIDRYPADAEQLSSLALTDIFAVEFYPHPLTQATEYMKTNTCAVLLVWTRIGR
jgi:hypothetical protein